MLVQALPEALYFENGVGNTPLEIATAKFLLSHIQELKAQVNMLNNYYVLSTLPTCEVEKLEDQIPKLRKTIAILIEDKKLTKDSTPETEFSAFARYMETQIASAKPEYEAKKKHAEEKANKAKREEEEGKKKAGEEGSYKGFRTQENSDAKKMFKYVKQAVGANPGTEGWFC
ncbi:hypothetical protein E1B28_011525 [Marasmius oreades]|uniref:Uncharacterized protein n=1 Tax=Marasmius oreades TaxID=181124 RepID=A0A9P7RU96_9AGAR|nr:uncharacterized protein E1B28_011525 [Marasmius oreades]KAG7089891.1 hypothetical protein E1B28_011525 [Marasmius oreades]